MNFVDAALALLKESAKPMHVEELCKLAIEKELLSRPGTTPLRSMKGRLSTELKKGDESRVVKIDGDLWALREDADVGAPTEEAGETAAAEVEAAPGEEPVEATDAAPPASGEGDALAALYADEQGATTPVAALSEYRDEQTADEDRMMLPEIKAERRGRNRNGAVHEKRRRRRRGPRGERMEESAAAPAAHVEEEQDAAAGEGQDDGVAGAHSALVDAAVDVLSTVQRGQALPVRQLTQMMTKRQLIDGNADTVWRLVKGVLLQDAAARESRGLTPAVVHRGRDLFALPPAAQTPAMAAAERQLEHAIEQLEELHRQALADRLAHLSTKLLERIAQVYLHVTGWSEIDWIKRVDRSTYATARHPVEGRPWLISVRAGPDTIERRGVGELRAGLVAKKINRGLLLSPSELSDEAHAELGKDGPPIRVLCGPGFLAALRDSRIATRERSLIVSETDWDFMESVLA